MFLWGSNVVYFNIEWLKIFLQAQSTMSGDLRAWWILTLCTYSLILILSPMFPQICWSTFYCADWFCEGSGLSPRRQVQGKWVQPQLECCTYWQQLVPGRLPLGHSLPCLREEYAWELGKMWICNTNRIHMTERLPLLIYISQRRLERNGCWRILVR